MDLELRELELQEIPEENKDTVENGDRPYGGEGQSISYTCLNV
jgi:hypothetical protein